MKPRSLVRRLAWLGVLALLRFSGAVPAGEPAPTPLTAAERPRSEIEALIRRVGPTPPEWFAATPLKFPKTLDLAWPPDPGGPWDPSRNVGQFIWTSINENEGRWREGIRFLHHVLLVNQKDPVVARKAMEALGRMYHDLHEDWARAAFWWEKSGRGDDLGLAHCYFKLGSRAMAVQILRGYPTDTTRHARVARLWSEMGDHDRGLAIALQTAQQTPDVGYLAAGDLCRTTGRTAEAQQYYRKVLETEVGGRDLKQSKERAQASLEAMRLLEDWDLRRVADGTYSGSSLGYSGQVAVQVRVAGARIEDVRVTQHTEKQYYSAIADTCRQIVLKQGAKGVDATSGATITSEAILNATLKAVAPSKP